MVDGRHARGEARISIVVNLVGARPVPRLAISWLAIRLLLLLDAVARVAAPLGLDASLG